MRTTPPRTWFSQRESAEYLGVTDRTIRNMIRRGELPARRLGARTIRIHVDDLEKALRPIPTVNRGA